MKRSSTLLWVAVIAAGCSSSSTERSNETTAQREARLEREQQNMAANAPSESPTQPDARNPRASDPSRERIEREDAMERQATSRPGERTPYDDEARGNDMRVRDERAEDEDDTNVAADNTGINERDRDAEGSLTPLDQGNNTSDLRITQAIRKMVIDDDSLSFDAKNVKIITNNGKVTLRGPVESPRERDLIESSARRVSGVTRVDNQIQIEK